MKDDERANKSAAIRSVLKAAATPLTMEQLQPRVEKELEQVFGRARLYRLLSMMQTAGAIRTTGRAETRAYALVRRRKRA